MQKPKRLAIPDIFPEDSIFYHTGTVGAQKKRLNWRAEILLRRHREAIEGKTILDMGSHDGRFSWVCLELGAKHVTGVEASEELSETAQSNMDSLGVGPSKHTFVTGDMINALEDFQAGQFDTILCLGVFYHTNRQLQMIQNLRRLKPSTLIIDTDIVPSTTLTGPYLRLRLEPNSWNPSNLVFDPTRKSLEMMLGAFGFSFAEIVWPPEAKVWSYTIKKKRVSYICWLEG